jgi:hypothetical protein
MQHIKTKEFNLFHNLSVFYVCFLDVKLPEDDLKKIETNQTIRGLNVKVYF